MHRHAVACRLALTPRLCIRSSMQGVISPERQKCQYFVKRKNRLCKFDAIPGQKFCGNHYNCEQEGGPKRVVCPFDPKGGQ
jgi:tRNA:m4X modification enzyme